MERYAYMTSSYDYNKALDDLVQILKRLMKDKKTNGEPPVVTSKDLDRARKSLKFL